MRFVIRLLQLLILLPLAVFIWAFVIFLVQLS